MAVQKILFDYIVEDMDCGIRSRKTGFRAHQIRLLSFFSIILVTIVVVMCSLLGWYIGSSGGAFMIIIIQFLGYLQARLLLTCWKDAHLQTVDEGRRHHNALTTEDDKDNADNDPFIPETREGNGCRAANRNSDDYGREDEHRGDKFDQLLHMRRLCTCITDPTQFKAWGNFSLRLPVDTYMYICKYRS